MTKISIIGLGWIGLPLAKLLQAEGHIVVGSTTSSEKRTGLLEQGIKAVQFELVPYPKGKAFQDLFTSEVLVVNIPPRSRTVSEEFYLEQIKFLRSMVDQSDINKVIFVSSTSVYPKDNREDPYTEIVALDYKNTGNTTIFKSELMFSDNSDFDLTIVRFGGLIGDERIPGKYVAGRENVSGHTRVNYIYRTDAVKMLAWIIEKNLWNETYNGVAPIHSLRKDVYEKNALELRIEPPKSYQNSSPDEGRLVSGAKILNTGFEFDFPDPLGFPYSKEI